MVWPFLARPHSAPTERGIDRYGRTIGQCFLANGRDIAEAMIASGTASEYCRYSEAYYRTC